MHLEYYAKKFKRARYVPDTFKAVIHIKLLIKVNTNSLKHLESQKKP